MPTSFSSAALAHLHASFLAIVLPRVLSQGRVSFRGMKCQHRPEDAIREMIGLAWQWHLRLAENGKDATCFPTALASYAARAVKSGCRVCGQERANDVLSPVAQQRHRFAVGKLPDYETLSDNPVSKALADNTKSPPDEAVCFKLYFTAWLASLTQRNRDITGDLMIGERTLDVADKYGPCQKICDIDLPRGLAWPTTYGCRKPSTQPTNFGSRRSRPSKGVCR